MSNSSTLNFNVFVKTVQGKTITLPVSSGMKVSAIKAAVSERECVPLDVLWLSYAGKPLNTDTATIEDINLQRDSTIFMLMRLKGGRPEQSPHVDSA